MHLLVTGGGSAGHVLPAVAVMRALLDQGHRISFVGTRSGLEQRLVADLPVDFYGISAGKLRRYWSWQNITDVFRILAGLVQALRLMVRLKPDVVFSKGGFVSLPVALAGWALGKPVVAHESDLTPGLANRLMMPFVRTLCVSFVETPARGGVRRVHTGTPVRREIVTGSAPAGRARLDLAPEQPLLVVTGGSLGADVLNAAVREALPALLERFAVLHICGPGKLMPREAPGYHQFEYVGEGWGDLLAAADVVVSRAGANALFELLSMGKLNVLVPLSVRASRGDQLQNADFAQRAGFSLVVQEDALSGASLTHAVEEVLARRAAYEGALSGFQAPDAVRAIADEILRLAPHGGAP